MRHKLTGDLQNRSVTRWRKGGTVLVNFTAAHSCPRPSEGATNRRACLRALRLLRGLPLYLALALPCSGQNGPTLQETFDWIVSKMPMTGEPMRDPVNDVEGTNDRVTVSFDGCKMTFENLSTSSRLTDPRWTKTDIHKGSVQLKLLSDPIVWVSSSTVLKAGVLPSVLLSSRSTKVSAFSGTRTLTLVDDDRHTLTTRENETIGKDFVLKLQFLDQDLANRVGRAFKHAITLCGGGGPKEKEPF